MKTISMIVAATVLATPAQAYYTESNFGRMYLSCISAQQNGPHPVTVETARQFCTATALTCARLGYSDGPTCLLNTQQTPRESRCSALADARGLHGRARTLFRAGCKS
jgi:hypothetical protein